MVRGEAGDESMTGRHNNIIMLYTRVKKKRLKWTLATDVPTYKDSIESREEKTSLRPRNLFDVTFESVLAE